MEELEEAAGEVTGQVTAGNSLSTEVAAPWNTSITIPAVQITQFHRHGRRPYHQPFSALPWTLCKFVWNVQFVYKHCAPYVVDFVLNFLLYRISFCTKFIFIQIATLNTTHKTSSTLFSVFAVCGIAQWVRCHFLSQCDVHSAADGEKVVQILQYVQFVQSSWFMQCSKCASVHSWALGPRTPVPAACHPTTHRFCGCGGGG